MCQRLRSLSDAFLPWSTEIKYLGVHIVESKSLKISTDQSRRSFYRAANAIFGRVGRIASEGVVLHLILTKCIPILLYGLEACPLRKTDLNSLDFVVNRFFMKLFQTGNIDLVKCCQSFFCFELPSAIHDRCASKFDLKYRNHSNLFCQMISSLWKTFVWYYRVSF